MGWTRLLNWLNWVLKYSLQYKGVKWSTFALWVLIYHFNHLSLLLQWKICLHVNHIVRFVSLFESKYRRGSRQPQYHWDWLRNFVLPPFHGHDQNRKFALGISSTTTMLSFLLYPTSYTFITAIHVFQKIYLHQSL